MSGIDSIQRRAWIAVVRDWAKSWYGGWKPPATYFTATFRHLGRAPFVYHDDDEAQEADAIVERLIRAHEHGRGIFHGDECCKQGELTANASGTTRVPCGRRPCMCDTTVPCWSQ